MRTMFTQQAVHFNALGVLVTAPLGVPSLMGRGSPDAVPAGITPAVVPLTPLAALVVMIGLAVVGFFLGAFYLGMIAQRVRDRGLHLRALLRALPHYGVNLIALMLVALSSMITVALPFVIGFFCVSMVSPELGLLVLVIGLSVAVWALIFLFFTPHALMLSDRGLFPAMGDSMRIVRANSSNAILFLITVGALYFGLSLIFQGSMGLLGDLLGFLSPDSWLWLLGLVGHAFIGTGLFIATFVYYKDRYRHYEEFRKYFEKYKQSVIPGGNSGRKG